MDVPPGVLIRLARPWTGGWPVPMETAAFLSAAAPPRRLSRGRICGPWGFLCC